MPTNYPAGVDVFSVPSLPEDTPLSQAGPGNTRNLVESIRDQGDAIEAVQANAAKKAHDHSGDSSDPAKGSKLNQSNTHQNADTDGSASALHHTIGPGQYQAAAGNHNHDFNNLLNLPYKRVTSITRPTPVLGTLIYETDTKCFRIYEQFSDASSPSWRVLPMAKVPVCRLRQSAGQTLTNPSGNIIEWHEELEDPFGFYNGGASLTNMVIKEPGLYLCEAAIQWDTSRVPDEGHAVLCINGQETTVRQSEYMRGNFFNPGFSQTLYVAGKLRFAANDVLTVKVSFREPNLITWILSIFFDGPERINSRFDVSYISP